MNGKLSPLLGGLLLAVGLLAGTIGVLLLRSVAVAPSVPVVVAVVQMLAGYGVVVSGREFISTPGAVDRRRVAVAAVGTVLSLAGVWVSVTVYGVRV